MNGALNLPTQSFQTEIFLFISVEFSCGGLLERNYPTTLHSAQPVAVA
jgi:hypothetical protein